MVRKKNTPSQKNKAQILRRRSKNGGAKFELLIRKTGQHMYADLIDLVSGRTLNTFSTIPVFIKNAKATRREASAEVGKAASVYCSANNISPAINIASNRFHGLVKEAVDVFVGNLKK